MVHLRALRFGGQALVLVVAVASTFAACASSGAVYSPQPFPMPGSSGTVAAPAPAATPVDARAAAGNVPGGEPASSPAATITPVAPADGYALSGTALSLRGAPYREGGIDPSGFDCSGFVQYVYEQHGVAVPRQVRDQFRIGANVDREHLQPGDLVFFSTVAPGASHVGIVIGGDQFVHAPSERGVVRVESLSAQYWASRYVGAKRVS